MSAGGDVGRSDRHMPGGIGNPSPSAAGKTQLEERL